MSFSFNDIKDFDEHILKSIPNYDVLISSIKSISEYFFTDNCNVYDLGCSTGKLLLSLNTPCKKFGYDVADLLPKSTSDVSFIKADLNNNFNLSNACVVYSIFTMQFLSPLNRVPYLNNIYEGLNKGGALILCEKFYQENGKAQEITSFSHYDYKINSFTSEEIIQKERDLRFIMKPNTITELKELLEIAGFSIVFDFWQIFNFKGLIAIK